MNREFSMDRRAYLRTVGAVGTAGVIAGCQGGSDDTITPGTNAAFPPFEYTQDGTVVGFDIDLAEEVIGRAGYEVGEWVDIDFGTLIPSLKEADLDLIAAGMTIEPDRQEQIDFSNPYWESSQAVLVRDGGDFQPSSVGDLAGRRVGAQGGTTGEGQIEDLIEEGTISESDYRQYDNYTLAVQDLENGNVDAVVIDIPVAETFSAERSVAIAFEIDTGEQFGLGMRQDDDRLADINDALAEIREDGTYDDLVSEWFE
ncbi:basic amino acid ABC transporter substrate-binding protein [Halorhabdus rudnickae]|uniref:basic amino acid ABC transporter substrate-binding protein n=1 Tax=Halorhabdus rudnickae TaxID=1775544 RepID=UPI00143854F3|nr:basic amino acid ABC transporter substrate-binding protein [Halorhabdus rudnickae]